MADRDGARSPRTITVNRAPVLTLWAAVVAERLGFARDEALTLGRAVAGLDAYSKGASLGLMHPAPEAVRERRKKLERGKKLTVALLNRAVPVVRTKEGLRAASKGKPDDPDAVTRYLEAKFGAALPAVRSAMTRLARSLSPSRLAEEAFGLYERFRPKVPAGVRGWGVKGELEIGRIEGMVG